jgi:hypothetical protein
LDIDIKDDGLSQWNNYLKTHIEPMTVTVKTPSGGLHYYFKYKRKKESDNYLISNYLTTKTKYKGFGLDIRNNGGYVVFPPSKIDNIEYKFIRNFDKYDVMDMPTELIYWLLDGTNFDKNNTSIIKHKTTVKPINEQSNIIHNISDDELIKLIGNLDDTYYDNYSKWLMITTVLKSLNKFDIWDEWSKNSRRYNQKNNYTIWNKNKGEINVNYLIHLQNENSDVKNEPIDFYKPYVQLTKNIECENIIFNNNFVSESFSYDHLINNETIILKSCTGTGKTTAMANHLEKYVIDNYDENYKLITIVAKVSLCDQHIKSFGDANIKVLSYEDDEKSLKNDHISICINSLMMYQKYEPSFFKNKIVFLDEINSFIESLTHNETLDKNIKIIYQILTRMIKNCHKLIVCDALISDNVFNLLNIKTNSKTLYITNNYKKYAGIPAINLNDENDFLNKLLLHCKTDNYFLFGSDSCKKVTEFYTKCIGEATEKDKHKYLLITSDNKFKIDDATAQFKNKFVFYSPSITYGVDYNISEKQDVFIYCSGKSLLPSGIFQQTTRTRQIKTLYYYCKNKSEEPIYNSLEDVNKYYENVDNLNNSMNNLCINIDESDNEVIVKNSYFKMFCYNEYVKDTYKTNVKIHFENILKDNGFILSSIGSEKTISKEENYQLKEAVENIHNDLFDKYVHGSTEEKTKLKYDRFNNTIKLLNLPDEKDVITKFENEIKNDDILQDHFNLIKLFKSNEKNDLKLIELKLNSYDMKINKNIYNKIKIIRNVEEKYKLGFLNVAFEKQEEFKQFDEKLYELIKVVFVTKKALPDSWKSLKMLYVFMLKNITNVKFIAQKQNTSRKDRNYTYSIDMNSINYHSELLNYRAQNMDDYHKEALNIIKIEEIEYFK